MRAIHAINEKIFKAKRFDKDDEPTGASGSESIKDRKNKPTNKGKIIIDATCAPADLNLLNEARGKTESIIDKLYNLRRGEMKKPRTYRRKARKQYLIVAKTRIPKAKLIRKAIGQQLRFAKRNLNYIGRMATSSDLSGKEEKTLMVLKKLYEHQKYDVGFNFALTIGLICGCEMLTM